MMQKIGELVSVDFIYNHDKGHASPRLMKWKSRVYKIDKLGLHYTLHQGSTLLHMFAVSATDCFFLLSFNTKTLVWRLEEIADSTN